MKPIPQIVFEDHRRQIFVRVQNNGVGPLIIEQILFQQEGKETTGIEECLALPVTSYMHDTEITRETPKVILPGSYFEVFGTILEESETEVGMEHVRSELSKLTIKVNGKDIYGKKIQAVRDLKWFDRYSRSRI